MLESGPQTSKHLLLPLTLLALLTLLRNLYTLPKLNERFLYFYLFSFLFAVVAAVRHVYSDVDRLIFDKESVTVGFLFQSRILFSLTFCIVGCQKAN